MTAEYHGRNTVLSEIRFSVGPSEPAVLPELFHRVLTAVSSPGSAAHAFILPSAQNLPAAVAIALSLALARDGFERRVELHRRNGFSEGARVAVLPDNLVFEFAGYLDTARYGASAGSSPRLLKLRQIGDPRATMVTLPESEITRLQHAGEAGRLARRGVRPAPVVPTVLDGIIGTSSYGNRDFFETDVILVMSPGRFESLLAEVVVSRQLGSEVLTSPASALLPWGRVHESGDISFSSASDAGGRPLLAVCSRLGPISTYLDKHPGVRPKIIIDGIRRISSDLGTFDRITARTDTLVMAGFGEVAELKQFAGPRDLRPVQVRPEWLDQAGDASPGYAFEAERTAAWNARAFERIETIQVVDTGLDRVSADLDEIARELGEEERGFFQDEFLNRVFGLLVRCAADLSSDPGDDLRAAARIVESDLASVRRYWHADTAARLTSAASELVERSMSVQCANPAKREVLERFLGRSLTPQDITALRQNRHLQETVDGAPVVIFAGWPGKRRLNEIVFGFHASRVMAVCYRFEARWFEAFNRRYRDIEMYVAPVDLPYRPSESSGPQIGPNVQPGNDQDQAAEPALEVLLDRGNGRFTRTSFGDSEDLVPAKQVWFSDRRYGFFSDTVTIPTMIAMGAEPGGAAATIRNLALRDLEPGFRCIFRHGSEGDIVRMFAEDALGRAAYGILHDCASLWRGPLKAIAERSRQGAGIDIGAMIRQFERSGASPTAQTLRNWLYNPNMIGPGDRSWLLQIAALAEDEAFRARVDDVWSAIEALRGAHMAAGHNLTAALISELPAAMLALRRSSGRFTLTFGELDVAEVDEVDTQTRMVPAMLASRLLGIAD